MKKLLLLTFILLTFAFMGCSKNKDAQKIVGTWNHKIAVTEDMAMTMTFTFDNDSTMNVVMFGQEIGNLTYSLNDGFLITTTPDGDRDSMPYSFNEDSLILIMDESADGRTAWVRGEKPQSIVPIDTVHTQQPLPTPVQ